MGYAGKPDKRKIVAVIGSGSSLAADQKDGPFTMGIWIARHHYHLLTGGGAGVMEAVSEGFCSVDREGLAIGVIPSGKPPEQYPNRWVELPVFTHLKGEDPWGHDSRNHINVRSCHALVAFPGGAGTQAELELALRQPRLKGRMVACLRARELIGRLDAEAVCALGVAVVAEVNGVIAFLCQALE